MHYKVHHLYYSQFSYEHVSAASEAILRVTLLQEYIGYGWLH